MPRALGPRRRVRPRGPRHRGQDRRLARRPERGRQQRQPALGALEDAARRAARMQNSSTPASRTMASPTRPRPTRCARRSLSRRRREEIYKPRSKAPAPAPRPPAPRATLTSQKVRRGSPPPRRRQAAASPFPRPPWHKSSRAGPRRPTVGDAVARLSEGGWRRGVVVAREDPEDGPVEEGGHVVERAEAARNATTSSRCATRTPPRTRRSRSPRMMESSSRWAAGSPRP